MPVKEPIVIYGTFYNCHPKHIKTTTAKNEGLAPKPRLQVLTFVSKSTRSNFNCQFIASLETAVGDCAKAMRLVFFSTQILNLSSSNSSRGIIRCKWRVVPVLESSQLL